MDWWTTDVCTSTTATSPAAPTSDSSAAVVAVLCPGLPGSAGSLLLLPLLGHACLCSDAGVFPLLQSCGAALDDRFRHMVLLLRASQMCLYCGLRCRLWNTHDRRALWRRHGTCSDHFLQGGVRRHVGLATPVGDLVAHFSECSSHDTCALMCLLWSLGNALGVRHDGLLQRMFVHECPGCSHLPSPPRLVSTDFNAGSCFSTRYCRSCPRGYGGCRGRRAGAFLRLGNLLLFQSIVSWPAMREDLHVVLAAQVAPIAEWHQESAVYRPPSPRQLPTKQ